MTLEIVPATSALIEATEKWLKAEEVAYEACFRAAEDSEWDISPPTRGFLCNWDMVKRNWQEHDGEVHFLIESGKSIGFLWGTDILEVRPDERRKGYGRLLADFMIKRAYAEGRSLIEIEIAPRSAIPFWQAMGFTLIEGRQGAGGGSYAYRQFDRKFSLGAGTKVLCSIEFYTQEERYSSRIPFYSFEGLGELLLDNTIQLPERAVCFTPEDVYGGSFARITVNGKTIFFDKSKRTEGAKCGIQCDAGYTYFIERLRIPQG